MLKRVESFTVRWRSWLNTLPMLTPLWQKRMYRRKITAVIEATAVVEAIDATCSHIAGHSLLICRLRASTWEVELRFHLRAVSWGTLPIPELMLGERFSHASCSCQGGVDVRHDELGTGDSEHCVALRSAKLVVRCLRIAVKYMVPSWWPSCLGPHTFLSAKVELMLP